MLLLNAAVLVAFVPIIAATAVVDGAVATTIVSFAAAVVVAVNAAVTTVASLLICMLTLSQVSFCRNSKSEQEKVCQSIMDEITLLGKLQHPHLIKCLGATKHAGHFNIFLEWMAGKMVCN